MHKSSWKLLLEAILILRSIFFRNRCWKFTLYLCPVMRVKNSSTRIWNWYYWTRVRGEFIGLESICVVNVGILLTGFFCFSSTSFVRNMDCLLRYIYIYIFVIYLETGINIWENIWAKNVGNKLQGIFIWLCSELEKIYEGFIIFK